MSTVWQARIPAINQQQELAMSLNILLWGTESRLTQQVVGTLEAQWPLSAVVLPATSTDAPAIRQRLPPPQPAAELTLINRFAEASTTAVAWALGLPLYAIGRLHEPLVATWLASLQPDIVCVICFPWRIPAALLAIPTYGFLNLHPARLPAYRGPAPLFWQLRAGVQESAVTVHWMDATFDTGAIAAQAPFLLPDGSSGPEADRRIGELGATLINHVLSAVAKGSLLRQPQPTGGSYQSWPQAADFTLDPQWSAQHAFNFMRGTAEWQQPYKLAMGDITLRLTHALDCDPTGVLGQPFVLDNGVVTIQFQPGLLRAQILISNVTQPLGTAAISGGSRQGSRLKGNRPWARSRCVT